MGNNKLMRTTTTTLSAAPPRQVDAPIEGGCEPTICGIPRPLFVVLVLVSVFVVACMAVVGLKAVSR